LNSDIVARLALGAGLVRVALAESTLRGTQESWLAGAEVGPELIITSAPRWSLYANLAGSLRHRATIIELDGVERFRLPMLGVAGRLGVRLH
jgi:hypothetical protein